MILFSGQKSHLPRIEISRNEQGDLQAKVVIGEFQRSETKDGKKLWELYATEGRYYPDENRAELSKPRLTVYKDNEEIHLTSDSATAKLKGTGIESVRAIGSVVVYSDKRKMHLTTEEAQVYKDENKIFAPKKVVIDTPMLTVEGEDLEGQLDVKKFTLKKNIRTTIKPRNKK